MAWTATTSFETTNGSTTPTNGNSVDTTGDGSGWSGNWSVTPGGGVHYTYNNTVGGIPDGSWVMACNTAALNVEPAVQRSLTSTVSSGRVSFRWRFNKTNRDTHDFLLQSGSTRAVHIQAFNTTTGARDLQYVNGSGTQVTIASDVFSADTWYKVDVDFDCGTDTFSIYVNGVVKGTGLAFNNAVASVNTVVFKNNVTTVSGSSAGTIHYIDLIADGTVVATPTNAIFFGAPF